MARTIDPELERQLRAESEATREDAYREEVAVERPNRSRVYSIRLTDEERERIERVAGARHLPSSTLVRAWILEKLDSETAA